MGLCPQPYARGKLDEWLNRHLNMNEFIKQHLVQTPRCMKKQADKHHSESEFAVGDMVYMKLQPYAQSTVMARSNQKLGFKFFGPFRILEHIVLVAYRLQLRRGQQFIQ
jgi:hypothetical protein